MEKKVRVNLGDNSYNIFVDNDNLDKVGEMVKEILPRVNKTYIISNPTVFSLYGDKVMESLRQAQLNPAYGLIPDGEEYKTLEYAEKFYDQLIEHQMDRSSLILSLGGGVVGDLAGFVAATYMRGVNFVQIPTTLLAQVDSSIGGKVAVNHQSGKNLIGAFYQPAFVLIDVLTLKTLEKREFIAGMAEIIKHGMGLDRDYFTYIEDNLESILNLDNSIIIELISGSCHLKGKVVEIDEEEMGYRKVLNFGHTIGHALEAISDYKRFRHGEAVAIGMVYNSRLAHQMGLIEKEVVERLINLLKEIDLPIEIPSEIKQEDIWEAIKNDKKSFHNRIPLILPTDIGEVEQIYNWSKYTDFNNLDLN